MCSTSSPPPCDSPAPDDTDVSADSDNDCDDWIPAAQARLARLIGTVESTDQHERNTPPPADPGADDVVDAVDLNSSQDLLLAKDDR